MENSWLGEFSIGLSCFCMFYKLRQWKPLFHSNFSRMFVNSLGQYCLPPEKKQVYLVFKISLHQGKVWAGFFAAIYKRLGFPTCAQCTFVFHVIPVRSGGGGEQENWHEHEAHAACYGVSNKVYFLWPRSSCALPTSMKPWQANLLAS